jgi:hypothetical protein
MFICKFCQKQCLSQNSVLGHEYRCSMNPNRKSQWNEGKIGLQVAWNKGLPGTFTGKKHTNGSKAKIAKSMHGNQNANHRGDRQSYYNNIRMDSGWEVKTAQYFDLQGIHWKYNEKGYSLSDGRVYYPDFFIYENSKFIKLVEVKGYFREANRLKFEMFLREYPNIIVELWQKQELKERKII